VVEGGGGGGEDGDKGGGGGGQGEEGERVDDAGETTKDATSGHGGGERPLLRVSCVVCLGGRPRELGVCSGVLSVCRWSLRQKDVIISS
jgi:hypothetical protein